MLTAWAVVAAMLFLSLPNYSCQQPVTTEAPQDGEPPAEEEPQHLDSLGALQILLGEVLLPASASSRVTAHMPSKPLSGGDVVTSETGTRYSIGASTWFVFIDDAPEAFFAHPVRYVFIDAASGEYEVVTESWPPEINGDSLWNAPTQAWHLIEVLSVLDSAVHGSSSSSNAPKADYGDAPDETDAYWGIPGRFPTLYDTKNSVQEQHGCHAVTTGMETLGHSVSTETDAMDPADIDGVPNMADADSDERVFVILDGSESRLAFTVSVDRSAPDVARYLNVLIDFDQSGNWSTGSNGDEWPVVNLPVNVPPGSSETVITPVFAWGTGSVRSSPVWMRALLSRNNITATAFQAVGGWDGSGTFNYGEVEDYFVFLMEKPPPPERVRWPPEPGLPPGGDGKKNGGGPPPAPGPAKGPCGYDINYYVIVINCGDNSKDLANGTPIVQSSCDALSGAAQDQGYNSIANLGPNQAGSSKTSLANIGNAFNQLASSVNCGDHVLIYICGHGREDGGIAIKNSSGKTQEVMKPTDNGSSDDGKDNSLKDFLDKIPPCPDEDCETPGACCDVTVILESCFAGNFDVDGVTGEGRTVVGTSTDTESWASYPGGGVYTQGLVDGMRDEDADTDDPPDGVDPQEAGKNGKDRISESNQKRGKSQESWEDSQKCDCTCPCEPDIDVDKYVWSEDKDEWVNQIEAEPGDGVRFRIEIENTGKCRDLVDVELIDEMAGCLEYDNDASVDFAGEDEDRGPDRAWKTGGGTLLMWDLGEFGPLSPGEVIAVEYDAIAEEPGPNLNKATASGHCSHDYNNLVVSADLALVMVYGDETPPPSPEDVLSINLKVEAHSSGTQSECHSLVTIHIEAEDLTGGQYPVQNVSLELNGLPWFNSGPLSTTHYSKTLLLEADCGQPFDFLTIATNSENLHATTATTIVTPVLP